MLNLQEEFGIESADTSISAETGSLSTAEAEAAVEAFVGIARIEANMEDAELAISQIHAHEAGIQSMATLAQAAIEDNTVTPATVKMLNASLEASVIALGLPTDIIAVSSESDIADPLAALAVSIEEKEGFVKKMVFAIRKLLAKLAAFTKKMFLKVITTLNFNKSNLESLTKSLGEGEGKSDAKFEEKQAGALARRFGALAVLSGKTKEFKISDVDDINSFSTDSNELELAKEASDLFAEVKNPEDIAAAVAGAEKVMQKAKSLKVSESFIKNVKDFNSSKDLTASMGSGSVIAVIRTDGDSVTVNVVPQDPKDVKLYGIIKATLKKDILKTLTLSEVPSAKETLTLVETASKVNSEIKTFIDKAFSAEESISKSAEKSLKFVEDIPDIDKGFIDLSKRIYLSSSKIAFAMVMNQFKTVRNIIALGNAVVKVRELDKKADKKEKKEEK